MGSTAAKYGVGWASAHLKRFDGQRTFVSIGQVYRRQMSAIAPDSAVISAREMARKGAM